MLTYSRSLLFGIRNRWKSRTFCNVVSPRQSHNQLSPDVWNYLKSIELLKSTRGKRGGRVKECYKACKHSQERFLGKEHDIPVIQSTSRRASSLLLWSTQAITRPRELVQIQMAAKNTTTVTNDTGIPGLVSSKLKDFKNPSLECRQTENNEGDDLYRSLSSEVGSLNIQNNINRQIQPTQSFQHAPSLMVANVMSLVPKIDEVLEFVLRNNINLAFITETWLKESVANTVVNILGYEIKRRDRVMNNHGGVCLYIKDNIKCRSLEDLTCCNDHEILWLYLRPNRLPRGISCLIVAVVYHPPGSDDQHIRDHLFDSLTKAESTYPNCGIIIAGDFNRLDLKRLKKHFRLTQLVKCPTRKDAILDLIFTNMSEYYAEPQSFPPFGLSDHNTVMVTAKLRTPKSIIKKTVTRRDRRASCKASMGRYLASLDWPVLLPPQKSCEDMMEVFKEVVFIGLDLLMPTKQIPVCTADAPWMVGSLKSLILKRQNAFNTTGPNSTHFKYYRNLVNRKRKVCKSHYYKSTIQQMKRENPKQWWKEVQRLGGMTSHNGDVINQISIDELESLSPQAKANNINAAFLEPLEEYRLTSPLSSMPLEESPEFLQVSESRVLKLLPKPLDQTI